MPNKILNKSNTNKEHLSSKEKNVSSTKYQTEKARKHNVSVVLLTVKFILLIFKIWINPGGTNSYGNLSQVYCNTKIDIKNCTKSVRTTFYWWNGLK